MGRRRAAWLLNRARHADEQAALLRQLEQGGVGPGWEPRDWLWRPTFLHADARPAARPLQLAGGGAAGGAAGGQQRALVAASSAVVAQLEEAEEEEAEAGQYRQLLVRYLNGLAELDGARRAVQVAADEALLRGYDAALRAALQEQPGESGGGGTAGLQAGGKALYV